jgi:hypothetical protein
MSEHPHDSRRLTSIAGPPGDGAAVRIYDTLLVMASGVSVSVEEGRAHPPVDSPAVELAEGLTLGELGNELVELVMNAGEFRGHFHYTTHGRPGCRYAYVLEQPLSEVHQGRWDHDELIRLALALSRLVRDNSDSGEYAARITEYENGELRVIPQDCMELRHVYRMLEERDWLDTSEAQALGELIAAFRSAGELPKRLRQAFWKAEKISWERYLDVVLPVLAAALEGMLSTSPEQVTKQFVTRVPLLANELGIAGVSKRFCRDMYKARSQGAHGGDIDLLQPGAQRAEAVRKVALLQTVLRAAVRRGIADPEFRAVFEDDEAIRKRWPVERRRPLLRWGRVRI